MGGVTKVSRCSGFFFCYLILTLYSMQYEMEQWWIHHKDKVPLFEDDDKARLEDLTGRIPFSFPPF